MTMQEKDFVHCGLRHRQMEDMSVEVDQTEYIKNLNCIDEKELQGMSDEADPPARHAKLHPFVIGAIAWCIMARIGICIYVAALHRHGKDPRAGYIRKMNVLLRCMSKEASSFGPADADLGLGPVDALLQLACAVFRLLYAVSGSPEFLTEV